MIKVESLSPEWITEKRKRFSKDPTIVEAMLYALYLLEHLRHTGLEFTFKGGTSLVLLLGQPKRFSVDIDIVLNPSITRDILEAHLSNSLLSERVHNTGAPFNILWRTVMILFPEK